MSEETAQENDISEGREQFLRCKVIRDFRGMISIQMPSIFKKNMVQYTLRLVMCCFYPCKIGRQICFCFFKSKSTLILSRITENRTSS